MSGLRSLIITCTLIGLLFVLLIAFVFRFQTDNGAVNTILTDPLLNSSTISIQENLNSFSATSTEQIQRLRDDNPVIGLGAFLYKSIYGVWKALIVVPTSIFTTILNILQVYLFGGDSSSPFALVFSTILAIFGVSIIFFVIYYITNRSSD